MEPTNIVAVATGTTGAVAILVYIVKTLWAAHTKDDARKDAQIDAKDARIDALLADGRAQTAANVKLADVVVALGVKLADATEKLTEEIRRARVRAKP